MSLLNSCRLVSNPEIIALPNQPSLVGYKNVTSSAAGLQGGAGLRPISDRKRPTAFRARIPRKLCLVPPKIFNSRQECSASITQHSTPGTQPPASTTTTLPPCDLETDPKTSGHRPYTRTPSPANMAEPRKDDTTKSVQVEALVSLSPVVSAVCLLLPACHFHTDI